MFERIEEILYRFAMYLAVIAFLGLAVEIGKATMERKQRQRAARLGDDVAEAN